MVSCSRKRGAFTLVELLVVIGIISVLISTLLPALNKARQAANSVVCLSNLRAIGQLVAIYSAQNKNTLPPASWTQTTSGAPGWSNPGLNSGVNPQNNTRADSAPCALWPDFLTLLTTKRVLTDYAGATTGVPSAGDYKGYNLAYASNMAGDFSGIFHDTDAPNLPIKPRVSMYYVNMRVIPPLNCRDRYTMTSSTAPNSVGYPGGTYVFHHLRKAGSIRRAAEVMMMWCGPVNVTDGGTIDIAQYDYASWSLDSSAYGGAHTYCNPAPDWTGFKNYDQRIGICSDATIGGSSSTAGSVTPTALKAANVDTRNLSPFTNAMRFRHLNNSSVNALFVDGHVEARKLGDVYARDICMNWQ